MKQIFLLIAVFIIAGITVLPAQESKLIGKWKGTSRAVEGIIIMDKKGYVSINQGGEIVGGKKYISEGVAMKMTYETNDLADPKTIDFVIQSLDGEIELLRMLGIYKFINDKTLLLNMKFDGSARPTVFDPKSPEQITLSKIK